MVLQIFKLHWHLAAVWSAGCNTMERYVVKLYLISALLCPQVLEDGGFGFNPGLLQE